MNHPCHPTADQIDVLIKFLERNPKLAQGITHRTPQAREHNRRLWEKVAIRLNNLNGPKKSPRQWNRYWVDKKSAVKKKAEKIAAAKRDGRNIDELSELTAVEESIVAICGDDFILPTINIKKENETEDAGLQMDSDSMRSDSPENIKRSEDSQQQQGNVSPSPPVSPSLEDASLPYEEVLFPQLDQPGSPQQVSDSRRTARNIRRTGSCAFRRLRSVAPNSPWKVEYCRLKERALRAEAERIEIQRRNSRIMQTLMEQSNEREYRMLEALSTLGEGMTAIGAGLSAIGQGFQALAQIASNFKPRDLNSN